MKILFNFISIMIVLSIIFLAFLNTQTVFDLTVLASGSQLVTYKNVELLAVILIVFIAGLNVGVFWSAAYYVPMSAKLKEYQKQLEKTSIQSEEGSSRVTVLEEKIKVLEKALNNALGQNE